jgi:carbon storage regulator CsrA
MSARVDSYPEGDIAMAPGAFRRTAIEEEAEDRLRRCGYLALRDISCEISEGVARLRGHLPTRYLKQVAQAIVTEVEGVVVVMNQIEVIASGNDSPIGRGDGSRRSALVPTESSSEAQAEPPTRKEPRTMLVLGRKVHETITIGDKIRITVLRVSGNRAWLGVEAPENIAVIREELFGPNDGHSGAGEPTVPRPPGVRATDNEPLWGRSRHETGRGLGPRLPRSPSARRCGRSRKDPRRQGSRRPRRRNS